MESAFGEQSGDARWPREKIKRPGRYSVPTDYRNKLCYKRIVYGGILYGYVDKIVI